MRVYPTRPAVFRIAQIDASVRSGGFPTATTLGRELEVSPRTVQRDIGFMRDQLGAPLEFDQVRNGYFYSREGYTLPAATLSEGELVSILVGTKVLEQYSGTPFEADLRQAFARIEALLPGEVSVRINELASATAFAITAPRVSDVGMFKLLTDAVRDSRTLKVLYDSLSGGKSSSRLVDPYKMACLDGAWYLVGYCHTRKEVRMFVPERIKRVEDSGERFDKPSGFDFDAYMSGAFKVMRGKKPVKVRLEFSGKTAKYVCERRWHASQKVTWKGDSCVLEMTVSALPEVASWVMGLGGECRVIKPEKLRKMVIDGHRGGLDANYTGIDQIFSPLRPS